MADLTNDQLRAIAPKARTSYDYLRQIRSTHRRPGIEKAKAIAKAARDVLGVYLRITALLGLDEDP